MPEQPDLTALDTLADLATRLDEPALADEARSLAARAAAGQFYVACVGQFKRGKSTLLDALLDERLLPTGIVPVTAVPTIVRHGPTRTARVRLRRPDTTQERWRTIGLDELEAFVSEERNPENEQGVVAAEVFVPNPLLASGMCLVDTPGLGSVFAGNSEATRAFVPHIDAAIVVIGADPPISEDELDLVADVARQTPELVFVLNKADRVTDVERHAAVVFARRVLERRLQRSVGRVYEVSAVERLTRTGPARDWNDLVTALHALPSRAGAMLVAGAARRGTLRIRESLRATCDDERDALVRPSAENEARLARLATAIHDADVALGDLAPLFAAEQRRLASRIAADQAAFQSAVLGTARDRLRREVAALRAHTGPALRRAMMARAQAIASETVTPWLEREDTRAGEVYVATMSRFVALANELLARLARTGIVGIEELPDDVAEQPALTAPSRFQFTELLHIAAPASPLRFAADLFLVAIGLRRRLEADAEQFLIRLLESNSARVQSDLNERIAASRRDLEQAVRHRVGQAYERARRAYDRAAAAQAQGADAITRELDRLMGIRTMLGDVAAAHGDALAS